jgi:hypothetical protein
MQLMHEMRPKPFHDDLGTKPNRHFPEIDQKVLGQNPSFRNWGFQIFDDLVISWGYLDHFKLKTCTLEFCL